MNQELPKDIGGLQKLEPWVIVEEGDVWVMNGRPVAFCEEVVSMSVETAEVIYGQANGRVYRRIPTPRNHCEVDWEKGIPAGKGCDKVLGVECGETAKTDDSNKPPLAHLPWGALDEVAMVQAYGHKKYGDFYNYKKGMEVSRNISCAIRHLRAYMGREDLDAESGLPHLAHAACRILFALQNIKDGKAIDDRFKP